MAAFGKRMVNTLKYVVPPRMWAEPENAAFFARIRLTPNDPTNTRVTNDDIARMREDGLKGASAEIADLQAKMAAKGLPHSDMRPFWMLQDNCWNGLCGEMLLYWFKLNPYEGWNQVILPTDLNVARMLEVAVHPQINVPWFATIGEELLLNLRQELLAAKAEAETTREFGRFADLFDEGKTRVQKLAYVLHKRMNEELAASADGLWFRRLGTPLSEAGHASP